MSVINKQDSDGTKGTLVVGEFGYDAQGDDEGRVYVGTASGNVPLARQDEMVANEDRLDTLEGDVNPHIASTANPHAVTQTQVGLSEVDNTSDLDKPVSIIQGLINTNISMAALPYSGHTQVSKKLDNFVFLEDENFTYKVASKNRFTKFGDVVINTHTHSSYDATHGGCVADFTDDMPDVDPLNIITDGSNEVNVEVLAGDYVLDDSLYTGTATSSSSDTYAQHLSDTSWATVGMKINLYDETEEEFVVLGATIDLVESTYIRWEDTKTYNRVSGQDYSSKRVSDTFRCIQTAPIGTELTNTDYFQDRTTLGITNQVLAYDAYNTDTNAYEGIKTKILFNDASADDILHIDNLMSNNGFSKVSDFLWSIDNYLVSPLGFWQTLNKGAYQPFLNTWGTTKVLRNDGTDSRKPWYDTDAKNLTSVANAFMFGEGASNTTGDIPPFVDTNNLASVAGGSLGQPEAKYFDIVYKDQFTDLRCYAKIATDKEIALIAQDKKENGVREAVSMSLITYDGFNTTNENACYIWDGTNDIAVQLYSSIGVSGEIENYATMLGFEVKLQTVTANPKVQHNAGDSSSLVAWLRNKASKAIDYTGAITWAELGIALDITTTKPVISSGSSLSNDMIGNPINYPIVLLDRLASGAGCMKLYPLLVGQDGTDYTSGVIDAVLKDKALSDVISGVYVPIDGEYTAIAEAYSGIGTDNTRDYDLDLTANELYILPYTSQNDPTIVCDPKAIIEDGVKPKVVFSVDHSIYKGAREANQIAGRISTGDGYESKVLENTQYTGYYDGIHHVDTPTSIKTGELFLFIGFVSPDGIFQRTGIDNPTSTAPASTDIDAISGWMRITDTITQTVPNHSATSLTTDDGAKFFEVIESDDVNTYAGMYGEQLVWDTTSTKFGDGDIFNQLSNGVKEDTEGAIVRTTHSSVPLNIKVK